MSAAPKGSIVIVDDTPANLTVLASILSREGYKVRPANNGAVALTVIQNAPPDLILLDIQMPGLDGYEVCRQLKQQPATRDIPVVFISALDDASDKVQAFRAGGADYISKPFQIEEVLARVENQLTLLRQRQTIAGMSARQGQIQAELAARTREPLARLQTGLAALRPGEPASADALALLHADLETLRTALDELLPPTNDQRPTTDAS
jgi:CheY-like chemotaxis protein